MADVWVGSEIGFLKGKGIVATTALCPPQEERQVYFLALFMNECDTVLVSAISTGTTCTAQV